MAPMIGLTCKPCIIPPPPPPPPAGMIFALDATCKEVAPAPKSAPAKSEAAKPASEKSIVAKSVAARSVAAKSAVAAKSDCGKSVASNKSAAAASVKSKASSKATCKPKSTDKPAPAIPGMKYIYPNKTACLHVIKGARVWEAPPLKFKCKVFNVGTPMTVCELIGHLTGKEGDACMGWAVTEVMEKGDGCFDKGTSIEYGGDKSSASLAAIGWTEACGLVRPPVWLVLHKG